MAIIFTKSQGSGERSIIATDDGSRRGGARVRISARFLLAEIGIFSLFLIAIILLQWTGGAFNSETAHFADESAHYVTGLMVRDYVADGFPGSPISFAERFYARFPKVAFGIWPPLFHIVLGAWMLPTPDGRVSALVLMAFIMAAAAYILYRCVAAFAGRASGVLVGLLLIVLPVSQLMASTVMADALVMLTVLATAAATARWLKTGSNRDALWVGLFAGLALMSKGNGVSVLFACPLAIAMSRRFDLLRKWGAYAAAGLTAALGFGWELHSLKMVQQMSSFNGFSLAGVRLALNFYLTFIFHDIGWVVCVLILIGIATCANSVRRRERACELWASMAATGFSVISFHILIPHPPDGRYVLAGIAPLLVFVAPGARVITANLPLRGKLAIWRVPLALCCVLAIFIGFFFQVSKMPQFGFRQSAGWLENHPLPGLRYLIISDPNGEGAFIAEVASPINRSIEGARVMRASKLLYVSDWNGHKYAMLYHSAEAALADIERMGIGYVVIDTTQGLSPLPHWEQVRQMVREFPERLRLVYQIPAGVDSDARSLDIYRVSNYANPPLKEFEFQTFYTRGGVIRE